MNLLPHVTRKLLLAAGVLAVALPSGARAQVGWTDWQSAPDGSTVIGTMTFGITPVAVTYHGDTPYNFVQTGCGSNYWSPTTTYTNAGLGVPNAPTNCEMISLAAGGTKTLTFSSPVVDPLLALVSWNTGGATTFTGLNGLSPVTPTVVVVQNGPGTFGSGTITIPPSGDRFFTNGTEVHGVVRIQGTYTELTFTDQTEGWHGFTVGASAIGTSAVPEPATVALTASGLLALGGVARRRRR